MKEWKNGRMEDKKEGREQRRCLHAAVMYKHGVDGKDRRGLDKSFVFRSR